MRAVISRVDSANVSVDGETIGAIERGLLVYLGVMHGDGQPQAQWLADKLVNLRIFPDDDGRMNRSVLDIGGGVLLIPNFTLAADTQKGTRPSFTGAAHPTDAQPLFDHVAALLHERVSTATGRFGAHMAIQSAANGPVTIVVDTPAGRGDS